MLTAYAFHCSSKGLYVKRERMLFCYKSVCAVRKDDMFLIFDATLTAAQWLNSWKLVWEL